MPIRMTEYEASKVYDERLDEDETVKVGTLEFDRSRVLKAMDPIAYREGLLNWADSESIEII